MNHQKLYTILLALILFSAPAISKPRPYIINNFDSVIFDLSQAVCANGSLEFPIYIVTNDPVYAIDFSLKFDPAHLSYLNTTNLKPYLTTSAYFNLSDSTLRFSSYSVQPIDINTPLVKLRFNLPTAQINYADFDSTYTLLNGDNCSNRIIKSILPTTITTSGTSILNLGDSLTLNAGYVSGLSYLWSTGEITPSITIYNPGIYTVSVSSYQGCSGVSTINILAPSPLPIELIKFKGKVCDELICLEWETASEVNNDYFEIQKLVSSQWIEIGKIVGAGNSNNNLQYKFIDTSPLIGSNYYRLKQVDFDGFSSITQIINIRYTVDYFAIVTSPNPVLAGEPFTINVNHDSYEPISFQITDEMGNVIYAPNLQSFQKTKTFTIRHQGIYFLTLYYFNKVISGKIIIQ